MLKGVNKQDGYVEKKHLGLSKTKGSKKKIDDKERVYNQVFFFFCPDALLCSENVSRVQVVL